MQPLAEIFLAHLSTESVPDLNFTKASPNFTETNLAPGSLFGYEPSGRRIEVN